MHFSNSLVAAFAGMASLAVAIPAQPRSGPPLACGNLVAGLTATDCKILSTAGVGAMGKNSGGTVVGANGGPNKWEVHNKSAKPIVLVSWGPNRSWVNDNQPDVTYSLAPGASVTLSTPNGYSGAMSALYGSETQLVMGQISNTWLEFTTGPYGVIDISREVNGKGNPISATITSAEGKKCTSDFTKCFFTCLNGAMSCQTGYKLNNCEAGSQPFAQKGKDPKTGGDTGGCGGFGDSGSVDVTFS